MTALDRRQMITGLAAVAVAGVAPPLAARTAAEPAAPPVHRLHLVETEAATRWQFLKPGSGISIEQLIPSSLWDFDAHDNFARVADRIFSLRHVASGITFRQVHRDTPAFRFDYWDMPAVDWDKSPVAYPGWVDTAHIAIVGDAAVHALAGIVGCSRRETPSPFRVRFSGAAFSCSTTPRVVAVTSASPLDQYDHVDD